MDYRQVGKYFSWPPTSPVIPHNCVNTFHSSNGTPLFMFTCRIRCLVILCAKDKSFMIVNMIHICLDYIWPYYIGFPGPDASRPPCRKAKVIRQERREAKLAKRALDGLGRGESPMETKVSKQSNTEKSLEDFLCEPLPANPVHNLEVCCMLFSFSNSKDTCSYTWNCHGYHKYFACVHTQMHNCNYMFVQW